MLHELDICIKGSTSVIQKTVEEHHLNLTQYTINYDAIRCTYTTVHYHDTTTGTRDGFISNKDHENQFHIPHLSPPPKLHNPAYLKYTR